MGSIGILCLLLIVLIAVISSKEIKRVVGRFAEVIAFHVVPYLLKLLFVILAIAGVWMLIRWLWIKLHQIFPKMWSLNEIVQFIEIIAIFIAIVMVKIGIDMLDKKLKIKYGEHKVQKIYDTIGIIIKNLWRDTLVLGGLLIAGATMAYLFYVSKNLAAGDKIFHTAVFILFPLYLIIKYIVIRKMRKHSKGGL